VRRSASTASERGTSLNALLRIGSIRLLNDMTHPVLRSYTGLVLIGVGVFCLGIGVLVASPADAGIVQRAGLKGQD
jgi:hypothetical protein